MKIYILSLILLIFACNERKDTEEIENIKLNEELARDLVSLSCCNAIGILCNSI